MKPDELMARLEWARQLCRGDATVLEALVAAFPERVVNGAPEPAQSEQDLLELCKELADKYRRPV